MKREDVKMRNVKRENVTNASRFTSSRFSLSSCLNLRLSPVDCSGIVPPYAFSGINGIVGLPNVGKSTLFNALTNAGALAANYPFATIEPNVGVVTVPDPRLTTRLTISLRPRRLSLPVAVRCGYCRLSIVRGGQHR